MFALVLGKVFVLHLNHFAENRIISSIGALANTSVKEINREKVQ